MGGKKDTFAGRLGLSIRNQKSFINLLLSQKGQCSTEILRWKMILDTESPENRSALSLTPPLSVTTLWARRDWDALSMRELQTFIVCVFKVLMIKL